MILDFQAHDSEQIGTIGINFSGGIGGGTAGGLPIIPPVQPSVVAQFTLPIYLAEITAYDPAAAALKSLRYSTGRGYNHKTAPGYYDPRIVQPANLRRDAFAERQIGGRSRVGFGELVLANADGGLDALIAFGFDGRPFALKVGNETDAYDTFTLVLQGTMQFAAFDWDKLRIRLRDRQAELDKPILVNLYKGDNALPSGVEGTAADLAGQRKPRIYGSAFNVPLPLVNTSLLIYQISDGLIFDVPAVRDRGALLPRDADYTSQTDMETNQPTPGRCRVLKSATGSYVRLGALASGQITCDVIEGGSVASHTAGRIIERIATASGGIPASDVFQDDINALDAASSASIGFALSGDLTFAEALDRAAASLGASWGFDHVGRFRVTQLKAPSGPPVVTFRSFRRTTAAKANDGDILSISRLSTDDDIGNLPAWRVTAHYRVNHAVLDRDIAGSVSAADRAILSSPWRTVVAEDPTVKTAYLLAREIEITTDFETEAAATSECARRLALFKVRRELIRLWVKLSNEIAANVDLNSIVAVDLPRFGYSGGKLFTVVGIEFDAANFIALVDLWG